MDFDFGFTAVDDIPASSTTTTETVSAVTNDMRDEIMDKLAVLEAKLLDIDNTGMINEHRSLLESDVASKLKQVEDLILPLLSNLKLNPDKDYIHWPNRAAIIDSQIEKIMAVTRYYERIN